MKVLTRKQVETIKADVEKTIKELEKSKTKIFKAFDTHFLTRRLDWAIRELKWFLKDANETRYPENSRKLKRMEKMGL